MISNKFHSQYSTPGQNLSSRQAGIPYQLRADLSQLALYWTGVDPSCSHKDYPAQTWVATEQALGLLSRAGWCSIISSSGNAAYAMAKATLPWAGTGRLIVVTDTLSPREMVERLVNDFSHTDVRIVNDPDATGSHAAARQRRVEEILRTEPSAFEVSQYGVDGAVTSFWANGYDHLCEDIENAVPDLAALVLPLGTGASLRSIVAYKMKHRRRWKIYGVDAMGSALLGAAIGARNFSGYGNGKATLWLNQARPYCEGFERVSDVAVVRVSEMLRRNGLWMGASSAAAVAAALTLRKKGHLPHRGQTAVLCPDHGSLYSSTLFNPEFLKQQGLEAAVSSQVLFHPVTATQ